MTLHVSKWCLPPQLCHGQCQARDPEDLALTPPPGQLKGMPHSVDPQVSDLQCHSHPKQNTPQKHTKCEAQ